jgi:hypothetical protein
MSPHYDEAALFAEHGRELIAKFTRSVRATSSDVEDACSFAWVQFIRHQPSRDREWRGWLFRTAQREAWRLTAQDRDAVRIVGEDELGAGRVLSAVPDPRDRGAERLEFQEALEEVRKLSAAICTSSRREPPPGHISVFSIVPPRAVSRGSPARARFVAAKPSSAARRTWDFQTPTPLWTPTCVSSPAARPRWSS